MNEAALLAAVLAYPEDDAPRLIYADFLDEQGQSDRADFIRVQVHLAHWGDHLGSHLDDGTDYSCGVCNLRRRERELLDDDMSDDWTFDAREGIPPHWCRGADVYETTDSYARFRRGFIAQIRCSAADWLAHAGAILAAQPVQEVTLTTWPGRSGHLERPSIDYWVIGPEWFAEGDGEAVMMAEREMKVKEALRRRWPAVKFNLPQRPVMGHGGTVSVAGGPAMPIISWSVRPR